jgi:hypothetical protein
MDHLVLYRPGAGVVWILSHGAGSSFTPQFASWSGIGTFDLSSPADNIIAFDYNGTGLMDHLVLYRPGTGLVWLLAHGSANSFYPVEVGSGIGGFDLSSPADRLIAYDYSQTGLSNYLLAYRPGTGVVWILAHGSGNSFTPQFASWSGIGGYDLSSTVDQMISSITLAMERSRTCLPIVLDQAKLTWCSSLPTIFRRCTKRRTFLRLR